MVWIIFLSVSLVKKQDKIKRFGIGFLPHIVLCGVFSALLLKEPDFGTTFMLGCLTVFMLMLGGVPYAYLFTLVPCAALVCYRFVYLVPYRWERITAFLNPWTDPLDSGYQLIQAWIAVGSGGILGKGLGYGQQKLFYLPEAFTDFILAVIGEELGFVGIFGVCVLFLFLFQTGIKNLAVGPRLSRVAHGLWLDLAPFLAGDAEHWCGPGAVSDQGNAAPFYLLRWQCFCGQLRGGRDPDEYCANQSNTNGTGCLNAISTFILWVLAASA